MKTQGRSLAKNNAGRQTGLAWELILLSRQTHENTVETKTKEFIKHAIR